MKYPAHRSKLFQNSTFNSSSKIENTLKKKYNIKTIIEEDIKFINTLLLQEPLYNLEDFYYFKIFIKFNYKKQEDEEVVLSKKRNQNFTIILYTIFCYRFVYFACCLL